MRWDRDLQRVRFDWEENAAADPLRAILAIPPGQEWSEEDFFESGVREVATVLDHLEALGLEVKYRGRALDFGCGVGRLTQALAARFDEACGTDISQRMIDLANQYNRYPGTCKYYVNDGDLSLFSDESIDFIYSSIVLQHVRPRVAEPYLQEFLRILASGGVAVFEVPSHRSLSLLMEARRVLRPRWRAKQVLRALKLAEPSSYRSEMHTIPERRVKEIVERGGGRLVDVQPTNSTIRTGREELRYLDMEPRNAYVSKQYVVVRG